MNRITPSTLRRLRPRTTVISGAALGLVAGVAVYGAVSSSAEATTHTAFKAKAPVAAAHASAANCAATEKLEKGVCVVHVVRTVVMPPSAADIAADAKTAQAGGTGSDAMKAAAAKHAALLKAEASTHGGTESSDHADGDANDAGTGTPTPASAPAPTPAQISSIATPVPTATP
jgi:hypothetical protein